MKFSENWLRSFVNPDIDSHALSHLLTMAGLEVEALEPAAVEFSKVVIAEIISAEKHPDADRLQICKVNVGLSEPLQIVCGAANARAGLKAPCALVGAELPDFAIKQAKVRGVESFGMMCSAKELGLAEEATGLLELEPDAPVGVDIREYFDLDDQLFTLKLTPNRSDCLSIQGIAREVSALTDTALSKVDNSVVAVTLPAEKKVKVTAAVECPRYCGRSIRDVNPQAKTPAWMVQRLERSDVRSISAIVDITNYVLLEMGQPLHAFDAAKLQGDIDVRFAKSGESLTLLNEQVVELTSDMLVIADNAGALALAGIMGGSSSAVSDTTQDIFLESAFFVPSVIAGRARKIGVSTDSSYRFERGVDFANTLNALDRATALIVEICGGQVSEVTEVLGQLPKRLPVKLSVARNNAVLGIDLSETEVAQLLTRLQFDYQATQGGFEVNPPSYRFDLTRQEDLIEDIARMYGYENIPAVAPHAALQLLPVNERKLSLAYLRAQMVDADYHETIGYSFVDTPLETELMGNASPIKLRNPIASQLAVMRTGLWGGLIEVLVYNLNRKQSRVRVFEIGSSYERDEQAFVETSKISGLCYGTVLPEQWGEAARNVDFYDVKADVEMLTQGRARFVAAEHSALHPGQSAKVMINDVAIGWIGVMHPKWQQHFDLPFAPVMFELDIAPLQDKQLATYLEIPKSPQVRRDIAVLVDDDVSVQSLIDAMYSLSLNSVTEISLFDQYRGKGITLDKKSLAFLVLMQDTQRTLTDDEADAVMSALVTVLAEQFDAVLRS